LVYHNETKRAVLPNEVTSVDTVRALFVRSFPHGLSMRCFDSPSRKIYILDQLSGIFYELDDLRFVVDLYQCGLYVTHSFSFDVTHFWIRN